MADERSSKLLAQIEMRPFGLARGLGHAAWITFASLMMVAVTLYAATGHTLVQTPIGKMVDTVGGFGSIGLALAALVARLWRSESVGTFRADAEGLAIVDASGKSVHVVPRARFSKGWLVPSEIASVPPRIVFETTRGTRIEGQVDSVSAGEALLRELGLDAKHKRFDALVGSRTISAVGGIVASLLTLGLLVQIGSRPGSVANVVLVAIMILVGFVTAQMLAPRTITVGSDGIAIRGFVRTRFIRFADLTRVDVTKRGLWLHFVDGRDESVSSIGSIDDPDALEQRIREAMDAGSAHDEDAEALDALERQGRSFGAWRDAIVTWSHSMGSLRGGSAATETLYGLVRDAGAPAVKRIAAAIALLARGDAHREPLRALAETSAEPHVRVALERVLDGDSLSERDVDALEERVEVPVPHDRRA